MIMDSNNNVQVENYNVIKQPHKIDNNTLVTTHN